MHHTSFWGLDDAALENVALLCITASKNKKKHMGRGFAITLARAGAREHMFRTLWRCFISEVKLEALFLQQLEPLMGFSVDTLGVESS